MVSSLKVSCMWDSLPSTRCVNATLGVIHVVTARHCLDTKGVMASVGKACELSREEEEEIWLCSDAPGFTQAKRFLPGRKCRTSKARGRTKQAEK